MHLLNMNIAVLTIVLLIQIKAVFLSMLQLSIGRLSLKE